MLSVVVLTFNEARNIEACLESARAFADELLLLDSFSTDTTPELARRAGAMVRQRAFDNYPSQRNAALELARYDWVFFMDADERATARVGAEIRQVIAASGFTAKSPVLYWIPRKNYIFGKWIRHTGWSPDYQPRLMRRGRVHFDPSRPVHELAKADGAESYLREPLTHLNYETLAQFRKKQAAYTRFEAQMLYEQGVRPRLRGLLGQPLREFGRRFFSLEGYRDGSHGLALSVLMAYYAYMRQRLLTSLWAQQAPRGNDKDPEGS